MPATPVTFSNLEQLIERIAMHMTANGAGENTGERTQQLLMEIVLGVLAISGSAPEGVASIQPWDAGLEYTEQVLVSHNGFLWLYAGGAANTGTEPGTNVSVWMSLGAPPAPSLKDVLAVGNRTGAYDIGIDAGQVIGFRDTVSDGLLKLSHEPITDDNELKLPNKSGTLAITDDLPDLNTLNLHEVLVNGNETDGRSVQVSEGDGVNFLQGANYVRVKAPPVAAAARTLLLPDKSGTVATTDDVAAVAALVDGTMRAPEAYTPAGGLYPATYGGAAIQKGDTFRLGAGTMGSVTGNAEDLLIALVDAPGQTDANWQVVESNRVVATQAEAEDNTSTDLTKLVPPQRWWQAWTKGLTLTAFGNAVRGMLLTGYAVGANAAVAATDSIMAAIAKLQGQISATNTAVNGKLAKTSNLSDLTNAGTARANLGLGALAVMDYADATIIPVDPDGFTGQLAIDIQAGVPAYLRPVDFDTATGKWEYATERVLGLMLCYTGIEVYPFTSQCVLLKGAWHTDMAALLRHGTADWGSPSLDVNTYYFSPGAVFPPGGPGAPVFDVTATPNGQPLFLVPNDQLIVFDPQGMQSHAPAVGAGMIQITDGFATNSGTAAGGDKLFGALLDTQYIDPGVYEVELKLGLKVKDTVNSPVHAGHALVALEVMSNTVTNKAYGTLTLLQQPTGTAGLSGFANEGYDKAVRTWTPLNDAGDDVLQTIVLRGIVAIPSNATGGLEVPRYFRVRIASSDADHTVTNVGTSYIVWRKTKGV